MPLAPVLTRRWTEARSWTLETYLRTDWEASFMRRRAANAYAQLMTWYHGDISANPLYDGDLKRAHRETRGISRHDRNQRPGKQHA